MKTIQLNVRSLKLTRLGFPDLGRAGEPRHKKSYLKRVCGFCGQRMRSARQRTNHSKDCRS